LSKDFTPRSELPAVRAALRRALAAGSTTKPAAWRSLENAAEWRDAATMIDSLPEDSGVRIYRLRNALRDHVQSTPLELELATSLADVQPEEAESLFLGVLHSDR